MPALTVHNLKKFAPRIHDDILAGLLIPEADELFLVDGIDTTLKLCHFMGQALIESGGFTTLSENLHYSAARLITVWPRKFNESNADDYANNPEKIANFVYGGRMGNNKVGDGWKYRGGGILQLTGKSNYAAMSRKTGLDLVNNPDLARNPMTALKVATAIWRALGCNIPAEQNEYDTVTRLINGGLNGAVEREDATDIAKTIFDTEPSWSKPEVNAYTNLINKTSYDFDVSATSSAPSISTRQAIALQTTLKSKNYNVGDVDGNIQSPATVGAIAALQKTTCLPVTGEIDDDTEDAIQNADNKVVSVSRANETSDSLLAKGSTTIKAANNASAITHGVTASGIGLVGASFTTVCAMVQDQIAVLKQTTDVIPGLTAEFESVIETHMSLVILFFLGFGLLYIARTLYANHQIIISERVRKSANGEDCSH